MADTASSTLARVDRISALIYSKELSRRETEASAACIASVTSRIVGSSDNSLTDAMRFSLSSPYSF